MTLTKPECFRIWDARAYRKTEPKCISVRRFVALPLKRNFSYWSVLWGRHWGFMQLPVFRHKASFSTQCREATFALECTHIPLGPPPVSTGAAEWQNVTNCSYLKKKKKCSSSGFMKKMERDLARGVHAARLIGCNYHALWFGQGSCFQVFSTLEIFTAFL